MNISETINAVVAAFDSDLITKEDAKRYVVKALNTEQLANDLALEFNQVNLESVKPKPIGELAKIRPATSF